MGSEEQNKFDATPFHRGKELHLPTCWGKQHKAMFKSKKNIDTSRWKFPKPDTMKMPHLQAVYKTSHVDEKEEATENDYSQKNSSQPDKDIDSKEDDESENKDYESNFSNFEKFSAEEKTEGQKNKVTSKQSVRNEDQLTPSPLNMYWNLLDNVEKAEKDKKRADPEAMACKRVNERLDEIAEEFCLWTSCLVLPEDAKRVSTSMGDLNKSDDRVIKPDKLRKLFHIDLCQSTIGPYIPYIIRDIKEMPNQVYERQKAMQEERSKEEKVEQKNTYKQAYYIPPKEWFAVKHKATKVEFPLEDEELVRSFGLRKFMDFLSERGEKPPKMFKDMKKAHEDWLKKIKDEKKHLQK